MDNWVPFLILGTYMITFIIAVLIIIDISVRLSPILAIMAMLLLIRTTH